MLRLKDTLGAGLAGILRSPEVRSRLKLCAGVALVYYLAARASLEFALVGSVVTPIWPPTGIALVALFRLGPAIWPGIALAAFAVNIPVAGSPGAAIVIAMGNTLAPLLTWQLLRKAQFRPTLERLQDSLLLVASGLVCMTVSALMGSAALVGSGVIDASNFLETAAVWWAGDASGVLVFAPILFLLGKSVSEFEGLSFRRIEALGLILGLTVATVFAFLSSSLPSRYLIFPFVVWAAVRFGQVGAALITLVVTTGAIWAAVNGSGPFAEGDLLARMLSLQTFNVSVATTAFVLSSATQERRRALRLVEQSAEKLEGAVMVRSAELVAANERLTEEIRERDLAQQLLGESEELFRTLFESAPTGRVQIETDGSLRKTNSAFQELLGYSSEELQKLKVFQLILPEGAGEWRTMIEELEADGSSTPQCELRFQRKDGEQFWGQISVSLVKDRRGKPGFLQASVQDLTERRRAEALSRAEAERKRLYEMFVRVPAAVFVTKGPQHVVEFANPWFAQLLGDSDIVGKPVPQIFLKSEDADIHPVLDHVYGMGEPVSITEAWAVLDRDGDGMLEEGYFNVTYEAIRGSDGEVEGVAGHITDVTDLVRARSELEAVAAERAKIYRKEHEIAETLQRTLLPDRLPEIRGLTLAARYLPGSAGIDVGGDWYDVFSMPTGRVALIVGDVIGRGLKAAAAMGQLRIALRSYALDEDDPAEVLTRLSTLVEDLRDVEMATVFFGILDHGNQSFRFASAGHPAPLLIGPDGRAEFLEGGRRPPLGVQVKGEPWATADLEPGSTLLLYTDGLIETRTQPIDIGMEKLRSLVTDSELELEQLCDRVIENLAEATNDDVALLALRTTTILEEGLTLTVPADPKALPAARRALAQWFVRVGATRQESEDLVLASNEAIANAIEHAYGHRSGSVLVEAELNGERVEIAITDRGQWRDNGPGDRGRGLMLMGAVLDSVEVERSGAGTRVSLTRTLGAEWHGPGEPAKFTDTVLQARKGLESGLIKVARLEEDIDLGNMARVAQELEDSISPLDIGLVVDLSAVRFIDSAGVRVLFRLAEHLDHSAQLLAIVSPVGSAVRRVLDLASFRKVGAVVDDLDSATNILKPDG
jgi:anti-anti-sigma factor